MNFRKPFNYKLLIVVIVIVIVAFFGGMVLEANIHESQALTIEEDKGSHFVIPGFSQKRKVSIDKIRSELKDIEEFSTYQSEYNVKKSVEETRYFLKDIKIPLTTNKIAIDCKGIVKVGYDLQKVEISVNDKENIIYFTLPAPQVTDNYIIWDSVNFNEVNNIFNPIEFGQYKTLFKEIETEGLKEAVKDDIYKKAEANFKKVITKTFARFSGYTIEFKNQTN